MPRAHDREELCERAFNYGVGKSWECRDCACLDDFEYIDKLCEIYQAQQASGIQGECIEETDPAIADELKEDAE